MEDNMEEIKNPFKRELLRQVRIHFPQKYSDNELLERCYKEIDILEEKDLLQLFVLLHNYKKLNDYDYHFKGDTNNLFVPYVLDLTDINPLAPHHYCKHCKYIDYENETCPKCHKTMGEDGYDLSYELFDGNIIEIVTLDDFLLISDFQNDMDKNDYYFVKGTINSEKNQNLTDDNYLFIPKYCSNEDVLLKVGESGMLETLDDFRKYIGRFPIISIRFPYPWEDL